jgi:ribonuclease PH
MNIVMTSDGRFVEVQGTGEESTYSSDELSALIDSGTKAIEQLFAIQKKTLAE